MALRTAWRCFRETITRKRCGHFRHFPALRYKYTIAWYLHLVWCGVWLAPVAHCLRIRVSSVRVQAVLRVLEVCFTSLVVFLF